MVRVAVLASVFVFLAHSHAFAQRDRLLVEPAPPAHWGVTFSLTPEWDIAPISLGVLVGAEAREQIEDASGKTTV